MKTLIKTKQSATKSARPRLAPKKPGTLSPAQIAVSLATGGDPAAIAEELDRATPSPGE